MSLDLILIAIVFATISGLPGLCLPRYFGRQWISVGLMLVSLFTGLIGIFFAFIDIEPVYSWFPWPAAGNSVVGIDVLSAFFLAPIFLIGGVGAVYGLGYWPQNRYQANGRRLQFFWGVLVAGMALLVISKHALAFIFGWEVMALAAFFLISLEDDQAECRQAGWVYLIATHVSTLILFGMFALWRWSTGSYMLQPVPIDVMGLGIMNVLFFMALLGFGLKIGVMPLHFWLPAAHAVAPSHVSAIFSGVVIKMGIYGLLRFLMLLPAPPVAWGGLLLTLGAISGLLGVVFAIGQHDLKRLLAYHSVENIGIILMGLGLAMLGRSANRPEWIVLGLAGCLLHVWNHSLFKALLFLCAGSVIHRTHTREIDQLGGIAKTMPWTAALFLIGAVAICGLPPLNGFVSELFVYLGLFQTVTPGINGSAAVFGVPVLATIGALATACFVKVYGTIFLGSPRTSVLTQESPFSMRIPMIMLAACCLLIGMAPVLINPILNAVIRCWEPASDHMTMSLDSLVPLGTIGVMSVFLFVLIGVFAFVLRRRTMPQVNTWDCGYAMPTHRMQYSASSFAQMIVGLYKWVLRPRMHQPVIQKFFPDAKQMHSHIDDAILDRVLLPIGQIVARSLSWFHRFQQGLIQHYVLYILITVIIMLSTMIPLYTYFVQFFLR